MDEPVGHGRGQPPAGLAADVDPVFEPLGVNPLKPGATSEVVASGVQHLAGELLRLAAPWALLGLLATSLVLSGPVYEVARGVLYLVRDGEYITGSCLNINGGLYM